MRSTTPSKPWLDNPCDSGDLNMKLEYLKLCRNEWFVLLLCLFFTGSFGVHQLYLRNMTKARFFLYGSLIGILLFVITVIFHNFAFFVTAIFVSTIVEVFRWIDLFTFRKLTKEANERIASIIETRN